MEYRLFTKKGNHPMKTSLASLCATGFVFAFTLPLLADDAAKGKKVEYIVYNGYFEKNNSGLKGDSSYLAFSDGEAFGKIFGSARVGNMQKFLPKDAFDKLFVVAVLMRGNAIVDYKVEKVTAEDKTLYVEFTAKKGEPTTAKFSSPLILAVDKDKYTSVVFIETTKKVEKIEVGK